MTEDIPSPALTNCSGKNGKKDTELNQILECPLQVHCKDSEYFDEMVHCINNDTYNLTETLAYALAYPHGYELIRNLVKLIQENVIL